MSSNSILIKTALNLACIFLVIFISLKKSKDLQTYIIRTKILSAPHHHEQGNNIEQKEIFFIKVRVENNFQIFITIHTVFLK
jgi:hypothetical protein